jgi:hypothetical protein
MLGFMRYIRNQIPEDPANLQEITGGVTWPLRHGMIGESDDGGQSWKNFRVMPVQGNIPGDLVQGPDGRIALIWCRRPHPRVELSNLLVRISEDGGKTWGKTAYELISLLGYPSSVVFEDGNIVTICEYRYGVDPQTGDLLQGAPSKMAAIRWKPVKEEGKK